MHRLLPAAALLALLVPVWPTRARGDAAPDEVQRPLFERLGRPARRERVMDALAAARLAGPAGLEALARALGRSGGTASADALTLFLGDRSREVRIAALASTLSVGLRTPDLRDAVVACTRSLDEAERRAAVEALGVVGDGRDVPVLLDLCAQGSSPDRRAAFRALRALTGARLPYDAPRWAYLWRSLSVRAEQEVPRALDLIAARPDDPATEVSLTLVRTHGWAVLPLVRHVVHGWFTDPDGRLRRNACTVAAALHLADFADAVLQTHRFALQDEATAEAATAAMRALGIQDPAAEDAREGQGR
jgi:hypothetical protein